jgi:HEAT repeat protein
LGEDPQVRRAVVLLLACVFAASGCGDRQPEDMPFMKKPFPRLEFRYQGRTLAEWRDLAPDAPAEERAAAAWAIAELEKDPAASLPLLLELLTDPDPSVRLAAVVATGRLAPDSPQAARLVVRQLEAPQEPLRRHARRTLGQLGAVSIEPLGEALGHESPRVVWGALASLAGVGEAPAALIERVAKLERETPDASLRRQALLTLPRLGPAGVRHAVEAWRSDDVARRAEAGAGLARGGPGVALPVSALLSDGDEVLAARAAGVLADLGPDARPALEALLGALERAGPVRFNAAEALIAIGAPAVPHLEERAKSKDEGLASVARYALERLRGE